MNNKILFIQPSPYDHQGNIIKKKRLHFAGLTFPLLAALTPKNWEVEICLETIEDIPWDTDAGLIGIGTMGHAVIRSIDIAKKFKQLNKSVIVGGYMASLMSEEAQKYCDSVVIGDADDVWIDVLKDYQLNDLKPKYYKKLEKLDPPLPRYELLMDKAIGNFLPVQAGRGCPHTCTFCSVFCLYRQRYFKRDITSVIRDIKKVKALGFSKFLLLDDNIVSDPHYMQELCKNIKALQMEWFSQCSITIADNLDLLYATADSGCIGLSFGLESISQKSMDAMGKNWSKVDKYEMQLDKIRRAGIDLSTEMVVGADGDTLESIASTAHFIQRNKIIVPRFYILTPIPGTDFFNDIKQQNRLLNENIYSYDGTEAVHQPKNMTADQLTDAYWDLYNQVFSLKNIFLRTIWNSAFIRHPLRYMFYLVINLYYRKQILNYIAPNII